MPVVKNEQVLPLPVLVVVEVAVQEHYLPLFLDVVVEVQEHFLPEILFLDVVVAVVELQELDFFAVSQRQRQ
jgi:hypothetical protein